MPLPDPRRVCVVLVSTRNPLNIGAAARAMSNFGIRNLRLVKPYEPGFREARSAVGAAATLENARIFSSLAEAVADCTLVIGTTGGRDRHLDSLLLRLQDAVPLVKEAAIRGTVAIVFGSEKRGLSNEDLSYCHRTMHIPTAEDHVSMNLGQAVAVSLYEITRVGDMEHAGDSEKPALAAVLNRASESGDVEGIAGLAGPANSDQAERLANGLVAALLRSGYATPQSEAATLEKVRKLVRRMSLTSDDAELLLGMIKQIMWKLKTQNSSAPSEQESWR